MKRLLILLICFPLFVFGQQNKVAVYVTGNDPINNILGNRLVDGIAKSGKYIAVERTASFLNELVKEQSYQQTGAVDDNEISRLGKQFGVDYVCVATPFDVWGEKYISARMIDVERAEVIVTSSANGKVENSTQLFAILNTLTNGLLKSFEQSKMTDAKKVAVYVTRTGNKDVDIILGDQLVAGFASSGRYLAIERTQGFLNQLSKEQAYQQTGAVDDSDLMRLGKQFGVQYVCVVKTSQLFGDYFIATRLIDVEYGEVVNSYKKDAVQLETSQQVVIVGKEIAGKLSGRTIEEEKQFQIEEARRIERERLAKGEQERLLKEQELEHQAKIAPLLDQGYVDLGLPSGTLWKAANEGGNRVHYNYKDAVSKFGNKLPTIEQFVELKNECIWTWTDNGYKVTGPNEAVLYFPAAGYRGRFHGLWNEGTVGFYWSLTPYDSINAYYLYFYFDGVYLNANRCDDKYSIRLVHKL